MAKIGTTTKEIFTALGEIKEIDGKHRFIANSADYVNDQITRIPVGKKVSMTFYEKVPARSQQQLSYYWVIMSYLAPNSGYTKDEMSDAIIRDKFGTKKIKLFDRIIEVRKYSISDRARFPKPLMVELIEHALKVAKWANVVIPTAESLGYISN